MEDQLPDGSYLYHTPLLEYEYDPIIREWMGAVNPRVAVLGCQRNGLCRDPLSGRYRYSLPRPELDLFEKISEGAKHVTGVAKFLATVAFIGYAPIAPGTAGSAAAAVVYWFLPELNTEVSLIVVLFLIIIGVWVSSRAEIVYGRDASKIVIDEFTGFFVAVLLLPKTWLVLIFGFFLFRFFDIAKPYPIRRTERLRGGIGVMADDILAGVSTNVLLRVGMWVFNYF